MVKPRTTSFPQVYASVANELMKRIGDSMAIQAGPPVSEEIVPATNDLAVDAWNARDPAATDEAMLALAQQKYQEHIAAGMTPDVAQRATAEDLTHFRYGQRLKLYTYGQTDYKEQVAEAKRLAKLAARKTTPNPPMPPPSMPSAALTNLTTLGAAPQAASPPSVPAPPLGGLGGSVPTQDPPLGAPPSAAPGAPSVAAPASSAGPGMAPRSGGQE